MMRLFVQIVLALQHVHNKVQRHCEACFQHSPALSVSSWFIGVTVHAMRTAMPSMRK